MSDGMSHVVVVGLGYIGLPTAAMLAGSGMHVTGVDINQKVVTSLNAGRIHIVEPGLEELVKAQVASGRLKAVLTPVPADVYMIAVPTPFTDQLSPDLTYVKAAASSVSAVIGKGALVILESTSPVGTTDMMLEWFKQWRPDLFDNETPLFHLAYCPERVLPGNVLHELVNNDRLIGGVTDDATAQATTFYQRVVRSACVPTNARTAEMAKLVENSFRDVNIAFANELSVLCDHFSVNVWELIRLANRHPRVNILQPGCGVGGHCIAVDPWFLVDGAPHLAKLIKTARLVNDNKPNWVMEQVGKRISEHLIAHPNKSLSELHIAVYGISFKPDIDDLRESPALDIAAGISQRYQHAKISIVEPNIDDLPAVLVKQGAVLSGMDDVKGADLKIVLVAHSLFKRATEHFEGEVVNVVW